MYSASSTKALDLFNSSSSSAFQVHEKKPSTTILKGHLGLSTRLKTFSLDFPFSRLVFVIGFNDNTISFFSFSFLSYDFHQNNGKKKGIDILAQGTHHGISLLLSHEVDLF